MKKFLCVTIVILIALSFYACKNETTKEKPSAETFSTDTSSKSEVSSTESVSTSTAEPVSDGNKTTSAKTTELCSVPRKDFVSVAFINESDGSVSAYSSLSAVDSYAVNSILSNYKFTVNPYDNLNDMLIKISGKQYGYDSGSGIFTYSDENTPINQEQTVTLNTADLKRVNKILIKYQNHINGIAGDKFIVKEINSTLLTMAKWDNAAGELKEGLFRGDYSKVENAEKLQIKVGDIITVYYETPYAETYPYQINITDILCDE